MLPSLSGFEVLRRLRHSLSVPVIMLTAHGADVDRIVGLELGADDYLSKPSIRASWSRASRSVASVLAARQRRQRIR